MVKIMGFSSSIMEITPILSPSDIILLCPVILGISAQSVTANRNIRRSDYSGSYEGAI